MEAPCQAVLTGQSELGRLSRQGVFAKVNKNITGKKAKEKGDKGDEDDANTITTTTQGLQSRRQAEAAKVPRESPL